MEKNIKVLSLVNGVDVIGELYNPIAGAEQDTKYVRVRNPMSMHLMIEPSVIDTQTPQKKLTFAPLSMFGTFTKDVVLCREHVVYVCEPQPQLTAEYSRQIEGFQRAEATTLSP